MSKETQAVLIVGLGGQARVVRAIVEAQGCRVEGHLDALGEPEAGAFVDDLPVLGGLGLLQERESPRVAVAIGHNRLRFQTVEKVLQANPRTEIISVIHPSSLLDKSARLGAYLSICMGAMVGVRARLDEGVIINTGAIVDHECELGPYCHVCPGVSIAGRVRVGEFTQIGIGASVIEKVRIGRQAVIGAGAVVTGDIPDYATAVGVPAKVIKISPADPAPPSPGR